jgi:hypothetical protein
MPTSDRLASARAAVRASIARRVQQLQEDRASGRGWWARVRALFFTASDVDQDARELERREQAHESALRVPSRWASYEEYRAARARAGLSTPRRHPRYPRHWGDGGGSTVADRVREGRDSDGWL